MLQEVHDDIKKSSAIPSWSGFIYQGKVALYHCLRQINSDNADFSYLKVETLDDFVTYNKDEVALSLHQVKASKKSTWASHQSALAQAAGVDSYNCNSHTERWFHVALALDDYSPYVLDDGRNKKEVNFYNYHDGNHFAGVKNIDELLKYQVHDYLTKNGKNNTDSTIQLKIDRLHSLLASRVNLAHHRSHHQGLTKFQSAESVPIKRSEILECLDLELADEQDESSVLFNFRKNIIDTASALIEWHQEQRNESESYFDEVCACRHAVACMDNEQLKQLYFSKSPNLKKVDSRGFSEETATNYISIVADLTGLVLLNDLKSLPHYYCQSLGSYLPTVITLRAFNKGKSLEDILNNIDGMRTNPIIQYILYEYDNLIVNMADKDFRLHEQFSLAGRVTEIKNQSDRITKMKNIRFISIDGVKDELNKH